MTSLKQLFTVERFISKPTEAPLFVNLERFVLSFQSTFEKECIIH